MLLQCLLHTPYVEFTLGTAESTAKTQYSGKSWGMCSKHCNTDDHHADSGGDVQRGNSFISLYPSDRPRLTVGLDHHIDAPIIGKQWVTWCPLEDEHFRWTIGAARWYAPTGQVNLRGSTSQLVPCCCGSTTGTSWDGFKSQLVPCNVQTLPGHCDAAMDLEYQEVQLHSSACFSTAAKHMIQS